MSQDWIAIQYPKKDRSVGDALFVYLKPSNRQVVREGDRVLFYEQKDHPITGDRGSMMIFASGVVTGEVLPTSGKDEWNRKYPVKDVVAVPRGRGVHLTEIRRLMV